jgi:hypothetical protein
MLLEAAVASIIIGGIWLFFYRQTRGSYPSTMGKMELHLPWLFIVAFGLQFVLIALSLPHFDPLLRILPALYTLSYLLLLYAMIRNLRLIGIKIAIIGVALNLLVIIANNGSMPANLRLVERTGQPKLADMVRSGRDPRHVQMTSSSRLTFLGDVCLLPSPYPRPSVFSVGDIFITIGACWLILAAMGLLPAGGKSRDEGGRLKDEPEGEQQVT